MIPKYKLVCGSKLIICHIKILNDLWYNYLPVASRGRKFSYQPIYGR
jgi:hypothetical protein